METSSVDSYDRLSIFNRLSGSSTLLSTLAFYVAANNLYIITFTPSLRLGPFHEQISPRVSRSARGLA